MNVKVNRTEPALPPPATYTVELSEVEMLALATLLYWEEPTEGRTALQHHLPPEVRAAAASIPREHKNAVIRQMRPHNDDVAHRATRLIRGMSGGGR